jgi:acyl transferase domain-containing protein
MYGTEDKETHMTAIAVISYSARSAGASDANEYWRILKAAHPQFAPIPSDRWKTPRDQGNGGDHGRNGNYSEVMAALEDPYAWDRKKFKIPLGRARRMDPQQRLALTLTNELLARYGAGSAALEGSNVGTILGVSSTDYRSLSTAGLVANMLVDGSLGHVADDGARMMSTAQKSSITDVSGHTMPGILANMVAATVQSVWDFQGPAFSVDAACASSLVAISQACDLLELGRVKTCIAGGVYVALTPEAHVCFSAIGAMSKSGECNPYTKGADGFVLGEGGALVLLKRLDEALKDNDPIFGIIRARGLSSDGTAPGIMTPTKRGQIRAIRQALDSMASSTLDVDFIEGHGTGTVVGDATELETLNEIVETTGESKIALGSAKAVIGHTMAASGALSLVKALLCIAHNSVAPQPDSGTELHEALTDSRLYVPLDIPYANSRTPRVERVAINSFGFGGTNGHLIVDSPERTLSA